VFGSYNGLMECETRKLGGMSSGSMFLRMDIGLYFDSGGRASYFINEVERTATTSLWGRTVGIPLNTLAATFGESLRRWMDGM
jgi:hypothetical protein